MSKALNFKLFVSWKDDCQVHSSHFQVLNQMFNDQTSICNIKGHIIAVVTLLMFLSNQHMLRNWQLGRRDAFPLETILA